MLLVLLRLFDFFRLDTSATLKSDVSAFIYRAVKESPGGLQGFIAMNELGLTTSQKASSHSSQSNFHLLWSK